ncbi:MAG: gamma carbonic anhydrase family protein [Chloroflexi bacterium]|nr:MAG: gamma carbonic anhydrase family protein [Chloroflexota bacterium]
MAQITEERVRPFIPKTAWIADTARVRGNVRLGEHVSVWFGAVIRGDEAPIEVGDETNVQDGAILHVSAGFPCTIGRRVTIGHGAVVHGCVVEDGALIGMRATVLDGARVGAGAMVGAGAVVPPGMEIPPGMLALGVPARVVGPLSEKQKLASETAVVHYLERKEQYRQGIY